MQRLTRFYCLVNPLNSDVFYVGRTTLKLSSRLQNHVRDGVKLRTNKGKYISQILAQGAKPIIFEIEALSDLSKDEAVAREKHWFNHFLNMGVELTNTGYAEMGGYGGENASLIMDEAKIAMLGTLPDEVLGNLWGCDRKTVSYHRNKFNIAKCGNREKPIPPNMGGWNKIIIDEATEKIILSYPVAEAATLTGLLPSFIRSKKRLAKKGTQNETPRETHKTKTINKRQTPRQIIEKISQNIIDRLGTQSDISLAEEIGVCKATIARLRRSKGIPSYADSNGHPTEFKKGNPHPRWSKLNSNNTLGGDAQSLP